MAHIPDGFLNPPVLATTAALSAGALAVAAHRSRTALRDRQAPLLGAATAFVFAAQMFNFPLGAGTSAHLLGGVLIAVIAGPWVGMLSLFAVVLVQALLFQDGGIAALGANALNLAVIGAGGGWLVYRWQLALTGDGHRRRLAAAGTAAFTSALATGVAVGLELGLSGMVPVPTAVALVGGAHVLVGVAEAALTVGILGLVLRSRPELVGDAPVTRRGRLTAAVTTVAVAVGLAAVTFASDMPDALEAAAERAGLGEGGGLLAAPFADYAAPIGGPLGGVLVALAGVVAAFAVAWLLFRLSGRDRSGRPA